MLSRYWGNFHFKWNFLSLSDQVLCMPGVLTYFYPAAMLHNSLQNRD